MYVYLFSSNIVISVFSNGPDEHPFVRIVLMFKPGDYDPKAKILQLVKSGLLGDIPIFDDYLSKSQQVNLLHAAQHPWARPQCWSLRGDGRLRKVFIRCIDLMLITFWLILIMRCITCRHVFS
jgi:hypothetical protein